jgi:beta-galactosidase
MVFIANYWNNPADSTVKIYSNCRQVKLLLNGKSIGIQNPDSDRYSTHLLHPPYTFRVRYAPGTLRAIGYINGREAASDTRKTPGRAYKIVLKADISGKNLAAGCNDAVFVYGYVTDENGTPVPDATDTLHFQVSGSGKIEGLSSPRAEAGIAAVLVEGGDVPGKVLISASAGPLKSGVLSIALKKCTSGPMGQ